MKLVKKALNRTRKLQIRQKGRAARGKIGNTFATFFDAVPRTGGEPAGSTAFDTASLSLFSLLAPENTIVSKDGKHSNLHGITTDALTAEISPSALATVDKTPFGLWLSDQDSLRLNDDVAKALGNCSALHLLLSEIGSRDKTSDAIQITERLMAYGFEPVLRSATDTKGQFRLILTKRDLPEALVAKIFAAIDTACDPHPGSLPILNKDIPVFIPCFNNQTYCRTMINQLRALDFQNITLIDNASTSPDMHRFLDEAASEVSVDRLADNLGPKKSVFTPERYAQMPRYFCVTDPDIVFNRFLPKDFVAQLIELTKTHKIGKAGFALNVAHRQFFRDANVHLFHQDWKIWEWEETLWSKPIGRTRSNDTVFDAGVDTTFAVYDKEKWVRTEFLDAVRVAGRFTAIHAPWYKETNVPQSERDAYSSDSTFSYYKM